MPKTKYYTMIDRINVVKEYIKIQFHWMIVNFYYYTVRMMIWYDLANLKNTIHKQYKTYKVTLKNNINVRKRALYCKSGCTVLDMLYVYIFDIDKSLYEDDAKYKEYIKDLADLEYEYNNLINILDNKYKKSFRILKIAYGFYKEYKQKKPDRYMSKREKSKFHRYVIRTYNDTYPELQPLKYNNEICGRFDDLFWFFYN